MESNEKNEKPPYTHARKSVRWYKLIQKEFRETLRDRRTIVTLIAMPLIVYPILSIVFKTLLLSNISATDNDQPLKFRFCIATNLQAFQIEALFSEVDKAWGALNPSPPPRQEATDYTDATPETRGLVDVQDNLAPFGEHQFSFLPLEGLDVNETIKGCDLLIQLIAPANNTQVRQLKTTMYLADGKANSILAARYLSERFQSFNNTVLQRRLVTVEKEHAEVQVDTSSPIRVDLDAVTVNIPKKKTNTLASIIPLILVLMTITGAVYPAIDLTAGERERGTLETLIAAPIPRRKVLIAKMLAVIAVAILTATLNVFGMAATIWAFQLENVLLGDTGLSFGIVAKVFGLLALFATFFSAILLVITSFARSFKEAQAYLVPVILLSLGPGLITTMPGLKLEGPLAVCPMVNLLLLSRDVLANQVTLLPAAVAVFSTLVYVALAIALAASVFGADSILYGGQSSWRDLISRPTSVRRIAPLNLALMCLLLLFPINFVSIGLLGRLPNFLSETGKISINIQLLAMGCFTAFAFFVFPSVVATQQRVRLSTGFGWLRPKALYVVLAVLLGLSTWPIVMGMINGWYSLLSLAYGADVTQGWQDRLSKFCEQQASSFRGANPVVIGLCLSLLPAFCEEWFFRGMLQRSFLQRFRPWMAVVFSAITFGVFHTLSGSVASFDRLLPSTVVGLLLGLLAYRANSIVPGIILHSLHNASIAFIAYYLPTLNRFSWFPQDEKNIPILWTVSSGVIVAFAILWLFLVKPNSRRNGDLENIDNPPNTSLN